MKIKELNKMTKEQLVEWLKGLDTKELDQSTEDIINYSLDAYSQDPKKGITKSELIETCKEVLEYQAYKELEGLGLDNEEQQSMDLPVEEETKKEVAATTKKSIKKKDSESKKETKDTKKSTNSKKDSPKPDTKKKVITKKKTDKPKKDVIPNTVKVFKETLDHPDFGKMQLRNDITTLKQFSDEIDQGKDLVFAIVWTKKQLKQFNYDPNFLLGSNYPTNFVEDLDICSPMYISQDFSFVYTLSRYTEINSLILNSELEIMEDNTRVCNGAEYQIYEIVG